MTWEKLAIEFAEVVFTGLLLVFEHFEHWIRYFFGNFRSETWNGLLSLLLLGIVLRVLNGGRRD